MNAEIITIGDELLIGQVIDTNRALIAERLNDLGISVVRMTSVGDNEADIFAALGESFVHWDIVVVTGGLGPTHDDITRSAVCKFFDRRLRNDPVVLEHIRNLFAARGMAMTERNEQQALVPEGCTIISNRIGTAPGYIFEERGKRMIVLPGVPFEMQTMVDEEVVPVLRKIPRSSYVLHRTLRTAGIPESSLADRLGDIPTLLSEKKGLSLAFLPSPRGVKLRISAVGSNKDELTRDIKSLEQEILSRAGRCIYSVDDEELEVVIGKILFERKQTLSIAESCTGGLIADRITDVPGSSKYFERAWVTYSNESKTSELHVDPNLLSLHGAVSKQVASAMAEGARAIAGTSYAISTTGIAGPDGGSIEKPVGLIWIGFADERESLAVKFHTGTLRRTIKERAAQAALILLYKKLMNITE
jgi:nicotinamide-nucleotide amidase